MTAAAGPGAARADWAVFSDRLGLTEDLLPIICRRSVPIWSGSELKYPVDKITGQVTDYIDKTPTHYIDEGGIRTLSGFGKWTKRKSTEKDIAKWIKEPDYGICLITRRVRGLDVDIDDPELAAEVHQFLHRLLMAPTDSLPRRVRAGSPRSLYPILAPGDLKKLVMKTRGGKIELLATGQQFVACGTHMKSGTRYEWASGLPSALPEVSLDELLDVWNELGKRFGLAPAAKQRAAGGTVAKTEGVFQPTSRDGGAVRLLLDRLPGAETYAVWISTGQSLHHKFEGSDEGLALWDDWSAGAPNYKGYDDLESRWRGFGQRSSGPIATIRTIELAVEKADQEFVADQLGITVEALREREIVDGFEDITLVRGVGVRDNSPGDVTPGPVNVPKALFKTTDASNMNRLASAFDTRIVYAAREWYTWQGTRWVEGEQGVNLFALQLSSFVSKEAQKWDVRAAAMAVKAEADPTLEPKTKNFKEVAKSLHKWAAKSESRASINAAVAMLAAAVSKSKEIFNRDPWLLNCPNGTVDLRTGILREHRPEDYITQITTVAYDPTATAPVWEATLGRITIEEGQATQPLVDFLRRWFGYCATGCVDEQKFVVHWGNGSNGKGTIINKIVDVLGGEYTKTAPASLLVSRKNGDTSPFDAAQLFGRRMVTAHEPDDGAVLKEGFVKQATGGDRITARNLYAQYFEFNPVHKIQMLTNYKPQIKGSDYGIWRRVLLMPYVTKFGDPEKVRAGLAQWVKDKQLPEKLLAEHAGILNWIVRGAREWYRDGLNPPDAVLAASADYQAEQDRIKQFVAEKCELGLHLESALGQELFVVYQSWALENRIQPLSKMRFASELGRVVPGYEKYEKNIEAGSKRKKLTYIKGIAVSEIEL